MGIDWAKYKTYNASQGMGNPGQWRSAFRERMGLEEAEEYLKNNEKSCPELNQLRACKTLVSLKGLYRSLLMMHHPDKGGDTVLAQQIIALYTVLSSKLK